MTSPPFLVPREFHVVLLTVDMMNLTDPSQNAALTPPGCLEDAVTKLAAPVQGRPLLSPWSLYQQDLRLGVMRVAVRELVREPPVSLEGPLLNQTRKLRYRRFAETA